MKFKTTTAASTAFDRFVDRYYNGDRNALRRKIAWESNGYTVAIFCNRTGHFLTYL